MSGNVSLCYHDERFGFQFSSVDSVILRLCSCIVIEHGENGSAEMETEHDKRKQLVTIECS